MRFEPSPENNRRHGRKVHDHVAMPRPFASMNEPVSMSINGPPINMEVMSGGYGSRVGGNSIQSMPRNLPLKTDHL